MAGKKKPPPPPRPEPMGFDEALEAIQASLAEAEPEQSEGMDRAHYQELVAEHERAVETWAMIAAMETRAEQRAEIELYIQELSRRRAAGWSEMLGVCRRLLGVLDEEGE